MEEEVEVKDSRVFSLPACPAAGAFASCKQIQEAGKSYGSGVYPIALKTPSGPELFGVRCEMQAFGGGWMLIAGQRGEDRRPPSDFVNLRFGEYDDGFANSFESFSIWPAVDFGATSGVIGLSWDGQAKLLEDLSPGEWQDILSTSFRVDAWVRWVFSLWVEVVGSLTPHPSCRII